MKRFLFFSWPVHLVFCLLPLLAGCHTARENASPQTLRVLSYNIHHGEGVDGRLDLERIAQLINDHQPDLVALQEVDRGATRTERRDLIAELARLTRMHFVFGKNIDHQGGDYGNGILSRRPVAGFTNRHYRMLRDGEQRGLLAATIDLDGRPLTFMSTHLDFRPDPAERLSNVAEIKAVVAQLPPQLVIVAGDFNDHPDGAVHRAMKEVFIDAWEQAGQGNGLTFSSTKPESRIDYVYVAGADGWQITRAVVLASQASDHLPLLVELERSRTGRGE